VLRNGLFADGLDKLAHPTMCISIVPNR
jgi:hypothetical protein